ncbi:MAG: hypothetical protein H6727_05785 [Myxococcales bacterium]|nr:hypothetical protein [Myxococcales bacterium]
MNPLIPACSSVLILLLCAWFIRLSPSHELRWAGVLGAGLSLVSIVIASVSFLFSPQPTVWSLGSFVLFFDMTSISLLLPMVAAGFAVLLCIPAVEVEVSFLSEALLLLATSQFALLAGNPFTLLLAETLGVLVLLLGNKPPALRRVFWLYLGGALVAWWGAGYALMQSSVWLAPFTQKMPALSSPILVFLGLGVALRLGLAPFSSWMTFLMQRTTTAHGLLLILPFGGVAILLRIVEPVLSAHPTAALHWWVSGILLASLLSALLALVQREIGRAFAYLLSAASGLVVAGALDTSPVGLVGSELLWASTLLGATGFGLCMVISVARLRSADLNVFHGLYTNAPRLGVLFLLLGMSFSGLPGSIGFIGEELILNGSISHDIPSLVLAVLLISVSGFSVIRIFYRLFFGRAMRTSISLELLPRERVALLSLVSLLLLGGLVPGLLPLLSNATNHHAARPSSRPVSTPHHAASPLRSLEKKQSAKITTRLGH